MFVLATFVYFLSIAFAAPVPSIQATTPDEASTRTLRDIVVSCLTTIFACTWVSMHPNIPAPELESYDRSFGPKTWRSAKKFVRRSLPAFFVALLFPEYIVGWAIRQRLTAGKLVEFVDNPDFTLTHAFFVIMGGVHKKTESGSYPLDRYQVAALIGVDITMGYETDTVTKREARSDVILPSEAELQDKSKSDWIAKLLVLIQILWFVIQCIARGIKHLPITQLEVITLAYAVLNFAIYIAWWYKPSRVNCPMFITADVKPEREKEEPNFFFYVFSYIMGTQDANSTLNDQKEMPNFHSGDPQDSQFTMATSTSFLLGTVFGALHCIDWHFAFTTPVEQKLWRVSSLFLTGAPFAGAVLVAGVHYIVDTKKTIWDKAIGQVVFVPLVFASPFLLLSYLAARIATIYVAFHSLHSLHPEAFIDVQWTKAIPHFW